MTRHIARQLAEHQREKGRARTGGDRLAVLVHERVALLQQVVLQRVQAPERLFVQALALIGRPVLVEQFLARRCAALHICAVKFRLSRKKSDIRG